MKQTQETYSETSSQPTPFKTKGLSWKWEKKHWLIVIAVACLALWWLGSQITEFSLVKPFVDRLPMIGSLCFAAEAIIKLSQ